MKIWQVGAEVGECPFWDEETQSLFWVDIRKPALHNHAAGGDWLRSWDLPEPVGAFALLQDGRRALVALATGLALLDLNTGALKRLFDPEPDRPYNRLNEGKVSPCGRFFVFGSMDDRDPKQPTGSLYCLAADLSIHRLATDLVVANGVAWSPDGSVLYFSDSRAAVIWTSDWDVATGRISGRRVFACPSVDEGRPDGAAMDSDGCYWSAGVSAGRLNCFAPDGRIVEYINLPVQAPTMPAFGLPGKMLITSHRRIQEPKPLDGAIVELSVSQIGLSQPRFRMEF